MSHRRTPYRLFFVLASLVGFTASGGLAVSACSSTETVSSNSGGDGSADAPTDRKVVPKPDADEQIDANPQETPSECYARCAKENPGAQAKYDAVDTCWAAKCMGPCVDEDGMFTPPDAGDGGDGGEAGEGGVKVNDGGTDLCGSTFSSGIDKACDDCTETFCCAEWDGCYGNTACQDYNNCLAECPE